MSATESGPVCAELLTAVSDDRLGPLEGDADLAQDVARERAGHAEHAEQDVLVGEPPFTGAIERKRGRLLHPRRDPQAGGTRLLKRVRPERLLEPLAHGL